MDNKNQEQNALWKQQEEAVILRESRGDQIFLEQILTSCFSALNVYGKQPEELAIIMPIFLNVLAEYRAVDIQAAFKKFLKTSRNFPTPADIIELIENKPKLVESVYVNLSMRRQNNPEDLSKDDWRYMREYEQAQISGIEFGDNRSRVEMLRELERLKCEVSHLKTENLRLAGIIRAGNAMRDGVEKYFNGEDSFTRTVKFMEDEGRSVEDILEFKRSMAT